MSERFTDESLHDPDDAPKLTEAWAAGADAYQGTTLVRRGRPRLENAKRQVSLRLDPEVLTHFRASGNGWQTRVNEVLRLAAGLGATDERYVTAKAGRGSTLTKEASMGTSKTEASKASKILRSSRSSAAAKSVAASDLAQAGRKGTKKKG